MLRLVTKGPAIQGRVIRVKQISKKSLEALTRLGFHVIIV
jgi:hypothetical protein